METTSFVSMPATVANELSYVLVSTRPAYLPLSSQYFGILLAELVPTIVVLPPSPSGSLAIDVPWPPLPSTVDSLMFTLQLLTADLSGQFVLGSGSALHVVNQRF